MSDREDTFFVSILHTKGKFSGFRLSWDAPKKEDLTPEARAPEKNQINRPSKNFSFAAVMQDLDRAMTVYLRFVPLLLNISPNIWSAMARQRVEEFVRDKGKPRLDLDVEEVKVYELESRYYNQYTQRTSDVISILQSSEHVPQVMIIGLVSTYDYFLSQLLKVTFTAQPEIIFTSQKQISFADLVKFGSIEEARASIIDREVESIIRESHQDQFKIMEAILSLKLREGLAVWPRFVEICERRNLFTHTGGAVSEQYVNKCKEHKCEIGKISIGDVLDAPPDYFKNAVEAVYEVSAKLNYVIWRKFSKGEADDADMYIGELCYDLIFRGHYKIAESILEFAASIVAQRRGKEHTRRRMIVNLANAVRLQNREEQATAILNHEDWSASDDVFQICVAAVKGDLEKLTRLMQTVGKNGKMEEEAYRDWPVFRRIRNKKEFRETFEKIYGESLTELEAKKTAETPENEGNIPPGLMH